jgi:ribosomal protein S21
MLGALDGLLLEKTKRPGKFSLAKSVNVSVKLEGRIRSFEQLFRKFTRMCKEEGIIREYKKKLRHETKGQKRRRKKSEGARRAKKNEESKKENKSRRRNR